MSHYFDYNATAPVRPEVRAAMDQALKLVGNPSSVHGPGREARAAVENARARVAALAGTAPGNVVFTGSGSEANNLALAGPRPARILASAIEHPSILRPAAERPGAFALIPVGADGIVDLTRLEEQLAQPSAGEGPVLVTVMVANNETGVLQPVADVVRLAKSAGALTHCDAIQAAGRVALDFDGLGCDLMSLSAHKIGGPKGVGALICRPGMDIAPLVAGGGQERSLRAGTENVPGIAGFQAAAAAAMAELAGGEELPRLSALRDRMEAEITSAVQGTVVIGAGVPRLANTSCFALPGWQAETLVIAMDLANFAVSAGSACSSGKVEASHVLAAMDLTPEVEAAAIRASIGFATTEKDIDAIIAALIEVNARATAPAAVTQSA